MNLKIESRVSVSDCECSINTLLILNWINSHQKIQIDLNLEMPLCSDTFINEWWGNHILLLKQPSILFLVNNMLIITARTRDCHLNWW